MKMFVSALAFSLSISANFALAHDEGHGPKLTDQPKQGGMVMPVISKDEANKGPAATLIYKSELVKKEDGTVTLYIYDQMFKPVALSKFGKSAQVKIGPMRKNPKWPSETFTLEQKGDSFVGKAPTAKVKPYYMDITLIEGSKSLLTAYENLD
jgi:hypothetical protein